MAEICPLCHEVKSLTLYKKKGIRICTTCKAREKHKEQPIRKGYCGGCHELTKIVARRKNVPYCSKCYQRELVQDTASHERCVHCRKKGRIVSRKNNQPTCARCYGRLRYNDVSTHEVCSCCQTLNPVARRLANGDPVCFICNKHNKAPALTS